MFALKANLSRRSAYTKKQHLKALRRRSSCRDKYKYIIYTMRVPRAIFLTLCFSFIMFVNYIHMNMAEAVKKLYRPKQNRDGNHRPPTELKEPEHRKSRSKNRCFTDLPESRGFGSTFRQHCPKIHAVLVELWPKSLAFWPSSAKFCPRCAAVFCL